MVSFVLDVSSALPLVYDDEVGPDTLRIEQALEEGQVAYVPTLWRYELCSALRQGERRGRVEPDDALAILDLLGDLHPPANQERLQRWSVPVLHCRRVRERHQRQDHPDTTLCAIRIKLLLALHTQPGFE